VQKSINMDADDIYIKLDSIKHKLKERVQKYYERLDKLFQ
jgi:ribosome-associated translation inhibitor RaiA